MRIIELAHSNVSLYIRETPRELPINRYTDFQKYLIQAAGIGSTVGEVEKHFTKLYSFLQANQIENAARETQNLVYNIHLNLNKIDVDSFAFLCLVDSIQEIGKPLEIIRDFSETALLRLTERLGGYGLTKGQVLEILSEVKKKSIED